MSAGPPGATAPSKTTVSVPPALAGERLDAAIARLVPGLSRARVQRLLDRYDHLFPAGQMRSTSLLLRLRNLMATGCRNEARGTTWRATSGRAGPAAGAPTG